VIAAARDGKTKTALQMVGILCLILGYPYRLSVGPLDLGEVDLVLVGRAMIYVSLFFSVTSAYQYVGTFARSLQAREAETR
jgi:CDP-diacylglycerol---glycerol-3-phosphate 3-phosphatidyltransferase